MPPQIDADRFRPAIQRDLFGTPPRIRFLESLKSQGKYEYNWQIFLYAHSRLLSNTILMGIGDLAEIMIQCLDAFPESRAEYLEDKMANERAVHLQVAHRPS